MVRSGRSLTAEERALWARVMASVRPLGPAKAAPADPLPPSPTPVRTGPRQQDKASEAPRRPAAPMATTLDASWDRRLARGLAAPESEVDLHGHSLAAAYARLDQGLERAIARGDRVLLLITGKPPGRELLRPHARGAIRAAIGDWLSSSRHADRIAAIRQAHPRHGGSGALYIVLRRRRTPDARNS